MDGNAERRRILIVEDDYLIASWLAEALETAGWQVVGPIGHLAAALDSARSEACDAAVLDVNLGGRAVYPVAEALDERKVPFIFMSGYGVKTLPCRFAKRPRLSKPFKPAELTGALARLVAPAAEA
jgi:DNA-binding response OmpR family regulator